MNTWSAFTAADPSLAAGIRALLQQYGPGMAYLATVRPDGAPRLHPVSPVITEEGLYCFVIASPKRSDLARDGRYALHSFPPEESDDEAYLSGRAQRVTDRRRVAELAGSMRAQPDVNWRLYEFSVDIAMVAHHRAGTTGPLGAAYEVWREG